MLGDVYKRQGENIAAREVEAVLHEIEGVSETAIVAVPDPIRKEEVKAYVKLSEGWNSDDLTPQMILDFCQNHLARFKHPRYISYLEEFPRTPTRKVAKERLRDLIEAYRNNPSDALKARIMRDIKRLRSSQSLVAG